MHQFSIGTSQQFQTAIDKMSRILDHDGVVVIETELEFLTSKEWDELEKLGLRSGLNYETVEVGDAGEPNKVEVGRLITDVDRPRVVDEEISEKILKLLKDPRRLAMLQKLAQLDSPVQIRRMQINLMHPNSFIGLHLDKDSNPDYEISVTLQLGRYFEGGAFVVYRPDGGHTSITPEYQSVTVSRCDYPHKVCTVESGVRASLVFFVSSYDGDNRRLRA